MSENDKTFEALRTLFKLRNGGSISNEKDAAGLSYAIEIIKKTFMGKKPYKSKSYDYYEHFDVYKDGRYYGTAKRGNTWNDEDFKAYLHHMFPRLTEPYEIRPIWT